MDGLRDKIVYRGNTMQKINISVRPTKPRKITHPLQKRDKARSRCNTTARHLENAQSYLTWRHRMLSIFSYCRLTKVLYFPHYLSKKYEEYSSKEACVLQFFENPFPPPVEQEASSPAAKDLRPSFALGRWQKAVSVAIMVSKTGNSGGLHQYIKSGKNKNGLIKVCQRTPRTVGSTGCMVGIPL